MKIVVLAGGISTERDVSIVTGTKVCEALRNSGHNVILVDVFLGIEDDRVEGIFDTMPDVAEEAEVLKKFSTDVNKIKALRMSGSKSFFGPNVIRLCKQADVVFMALHGENGEDGKIQATFDLLGIKYTGTGYLGSAIAMDKNLAKELFFANSVPTPRGGKAVKGERNTLEDIGVKLPVVVKPSCGGSSVGVSIANTVDEYEKALECAFSYEEEIVIEEYIKGREFSIGVVEGKALPIIEIAPIEGFYDYANKYIPGKTKDTCPAELSAEHTDKLQRCAEKVFEVLKLNVYARMDFLMSENGEIFCLEANTLPGMTPTSLLPQEAAAVGMSFEQLCEKIIEVSLKKYM